MPIFSGGLIAKTAGAESSKHPKPEIHMVDP
jgi:hypothetical protein